MRLVLLVLAVAACHRGPGPSTPTPANKAPAPNHQATADDVLGFLPADADVVIGIDMIALRASALWHQFQPQIEAFAKESADTLGGMCGPNPLNVVERMTMGFKVLKQGQLGGVFVIRGIDPKTALDCTMETAKSKGGVAQLDRGVVAVTYANRPDLQMAVAIMGTTMVVQLDKIANHDTMQTVLVAGAPLRTASPVFMSLFERRERGATMWGMANGAAPMFADLAQMGMRPQSIDGSIAVSDRFTVALRMTMPSAGDAQRVAAEVDKVKAPAGAMVERFDSRVDGSTAALDVVITAPQLRALIGMLGGAVGP